MKMYHLPAKSSLCDNISSYLRYLIRWNFSRHYREPVSFTLASKNGISLLHELNFLSLKITRRRDVRN
jgi:hypothetical protein